MEVITASSNQREHFSSVYESFLSDHFTSGPESDTPGQPSLTGNLFSPDRHFANLLFWYQMVIWETDELKLLLS